MDEVELLLELGDGAQMPSYATDGAAGMDLRSTRAVRLAPMERQLVPTGIKVAIPEGFEGQVRSRSGLAIKKGLALVNAPGTIDSDYRGEIGIILVNLSQEFVELEKGERIAQLVICPVAKATLRVVGQGRLDETERSEGGFGSTGTQ